MNNTALNIAINSVKKSGVKRLTLTDFRNYKFLRMETNLSPVIIYGENGSGKTNILEAVSYLSQGRGLRGSRLADIKRIYTPEIVTDDYMPTPISQVSWAVSAIVMNGEDEIELGTAVEKSIKEDDEDEYRSFDRRIVKIEGQKISNQAEMARHINMVWLTPQMDRLFQKGSQPRRSFLDRLVCAFDSEHAKRVTSFEQVYKEWNQLLKSGCLDKNWLFSLEDSMAGLGVAIAAARREQIAKLNRFIEHEKEDVFPNVLLELDGTIEKMLDTRPAIDVEDFYRNMLLKSRGCVAYNDYVDGVNRTDFKVYYKAKKMPAELCSTGEQKSLLISIILAQTKCLMIDKGFAPILLLDEVVAHLDEFKREALLNKILDLGVQAWITSTDEKLFSSLRGKAQFFKVENARALST